MSEPQTLLDVILGCFAMLGIWAGLCTFVVLGLYVRAEIRDELEDQADADELGELAGDHEEADDLTTLAEATGVLDPSRAINHSLGRLDPADLDALDHTDAVVARWAEETA